jgi:3-hydroxyisobutyrate dehydrogenase-like beta-hydroxyacid dehydrogenase
MARGNTRTGKARKAADGRIRHGDATGHALGWSHAAGAAGDAGAAAERAVSREYRNGFAAALMLKDPRLAEQAGLEAGLPLPLGQLAAAMFGMFCGAGNGDLDYSAIIWMIDGS